MAKEYYKVSHKTYKNVRVKPVLFQGAETYPLYVQLTFDRKTTFFKSYYFEVFAQAQYNYLGNTLLQIEGLESRVINYITDKYSEQFDLELFPIWYKKFNKDVLDGLDGPFKEWVITYFQREKVGGFSALLRQGMTEVSAMELLDDFKTALTLELYERLITEAAREAPPYIPLAAYVRDSQSAGPFCLPVHEWIQHDYQVDVEDYMYNEFHGYSFGRVTRSVKNLVYPQGLGD
jgi:hypothetical protein